MTLLKSLSPRLRPDHICPRPRWTTFHARSPRGAGAVRPAGAVRLLEERPRPPRSAGRPPIGRPGRRPRQRRRDPGERSRDGRGRSRRRTSAGAARGTKREQLVAYVTDIILVTKAAEKKNLQDSEEFKRRQAFLRNKMLMGLMLQTQAKDAVTDEEMQKVYDDAVKSMAAEEEVHARHILVETEDEAKAILEQLKGGADFADAGQGEIEGPGRRRRRRSRLFHQGPDGAGIRRGRVQDVSGPDLQSGEDAVRLAHHQGRGQAHRQIPPFEKVKDQIETFVTPQAQTDFIAQLRETAKIERLDSPATPPAEPPPQPAEMAQLDAGAADQLRAKPGSTPPPAPTRRASSHAAPEPGRTTPLTAGTTCCASGRTG